MWCVPFKIIEGLNFFREMFELFNVNDQKGLTVFEIENGVVDMTQTGDMFDRYGGRQLTF